MLEWVRVRFSQTKYFMGHSVRFGPNLGLNMSSRVNFTQAKMFLFILFLPNGLKFNVVPTKWTYIVPTKWLEIVIVYFYDCIIIQIIRPVSKSLMARVLCYSISWKWLVSEILSKWKTSLELTRFAVPVTASRQYDQCD